jgi:enoyl-CoA hydratase/carnithine racemase
MTVDVVTTGFVRLVTINRPEQRNALDRATYRGIGEAFTSAEHDAVLRFVPPGGDQASAGMDLKAFASVDCISADEVLGPWVFIGRVYPKPVIAAVNGAAVAGGFGIMLGCDLVVAADHATFGLPEVKRGLVGVGATSRAALRLPPAVTLEPRSPAS